MLLKRILVNYYVTWIARKALDWTIYQPNLLKMVLQYWKNLLHIWLTCQLELPRCQKIHGIKGTADYKKEIIDLCPFYVFCVRIYKELSMISWRNTYNVISSFTIYSQDFESHIQQTNRVPKDSVLGPL